MNKKLMVFGILGLFTMGLVVAGYYAIFSTTFTVSSPITIDGGEQDLGETHSGGIIEGDSVIISNEASSERIISFTETSECDVETSYAMNVDMNKKNSEWIIIPDTTVILSYVTVGDEFKYKVDTELVDYVVVYYPDLDGNPGSWNIGNAQLIGDTNTEWTSSSIIELPVETDWNDKAKLWLIPKVDWEAKSWNPTEWYFENNLVTYGNDVTIDAESSITVTPLYEVAIGETGECTVTTEVA